VEDSQQAETLAALAERCRTPATGVQILGLLRRTARRAPPAWGEAAARLARSVPRAAWGVPMEVLSVEEALGMP
jgi:hypothetical protein